MSVTDDAHEVSTPVGMRMQMLRLTFKHLSLFAEPYLGMDATVCRIFKRSQS